MHHRTRFENFQVAIGHDRHLAGWIHFAPLLAGPVFHREIDRNDLVGVTEFLTRPDGPHATGAGHMVDGQHMTSPEVEPGMLPIPLLEKHGYRDPVAIHVAGTTLTALIQSALSIHWLLHG